MSDSALLRPLASRALSLLALSIAFPGLAQAQQDTIAAPSDSFDIIQLDALRVEVLRTPIQLGTAPFSLSVLGEQELFGAKGLVSIEEVIEGVPGLQVQDRYNDAVGERLSIRGFGSRAQFGVRGIKVFVDDVPATLADGQSTIDHLELGSLGRVEVLRGPASMLYGGAAGGVLRFNTRQPASESLLEQVRFAWGSQGFWKLNSTTSGTAGETGYVAGLAVTSRDGFRTNPLDAAGPGYGESERLQLNSRVTHPVAGGQLAVTLNVLQLEAENPGSISDSVFGVGDREAHRFNVIQQTRKDITQAQVGARWNKTLGDGEVEFAAYGVRRSLDNPIPPVVIDLDRNAGGVRGLYRRSHETAGGERVSWTVGSDLDLQSDARLNFDNDGGDRGALELDQQESVRALGTFANVIAELGDRVTLAGGLRYDRVNFEAEDNFVVAGDPDDSGTRAMDAFSPSAGIHAQLSDAVGVFANVSTSFLTPTTTELVNQPTGAGGLNPELDPATSVSFEAGVRGQIGRHTAYELAAFTTTVDGELVPFEVASDPGRSFFRNAGQSSYDGFEASLTTRPAPALVTRATYSYVDAQFDDYRVDGDDFSGNAVPGTAPHRFEAVVRAESGVGHVEFHSRTVSEVPVDDAGRFSAPRYTVLDLRAGARGFSAGGSGLELAPFVSIRNLLDEEYVSSVTVNAFGRRYFEPAPSRNLQIGATATWARR